MEEASSANRFEGVVAASAAVGLEAEVVEAAVAAVVTAVVTAGVAAGVDGFAVGDRRAGEDVAEEADMTADVGEEGEERAKCVEGIDGTVLGEALEDIRGDEGGAYALHKVV